MLSPLPALTTERRYYICSFDTNVQEFARAVRGHWGIENGLHWVLDMAFREAQLHTRLNHAAENAAVLRRIALNFAETGDLRQMRHSGETENARLER
jgi:predicted transposase YbfD/YdcC